MDSDELIEALMINIGEDWESSEGSAESITIEYVREIERRLIARGGSLDRHPIETGKARVVLFKPSGKWYTDGEWRIPKGAIGPWDMARSPDFRSIEGGSVLVTDEQWGYPYLLQRDIGAWPIDYGKRK